MGNRFSQCETNYFEKKGIFIIFSYKKKEESNLNFYVSLSELNKGIKIVKHTDTIDNEQEYGLIILKIQTEEMNISDSFQFVLEYQDSVYKSLFIQKQKSFDNEEGYLFDNTRNNYLFNVNFVHTDKRNINQLLPRKHLTKNKEFELYLDLLSKNKTTKEKENLYIDSLKELQRNKLVPIEISFFYRLLQTYINEQNKIDSILKTFDIEHGIDDSFLYTNECEQVFKKLISSLKDKSCLIKLMLCCFHFNSSKWNIFFTLCNNLTETLKGIASKFIIDNKQLFNNKTLAIKDLIKFVPYIQNENVLKSFIEFPQTIEDLLELINSKEMKAKIKKIKKGEKEIIDLNKKYISKQDDNLRLVTLYNEIEEDKTLTHYYTFVFNTDTLISRTNNHDLAKICLFYYNKKQFTEHTIAKNKLIKVILNNFDKDKIFESLSLLDFLEYCQINKDFVGEIQNKLSNEKMIQFLKNLYFKINDFKSFQQLNEILNKIQNIDKLIRIIQNTFIKIASITNDFENFKSCFESLKQLLNKNNNLFTQNDLLYLENNSAIEHHINIFKYFLSNGKDYLDDETYIYIMNYLINNINLNKEDTLIEIYNVIHKSKKNFFFDSIENYILSKTDFYESKQAFSYKLLNKLIYENIFQTYINQQDIKYIKETVLTLKDIKSKLTERMIFPNQAFKLIALQPNLNKRIEILFYDNSNIKEIQQKANDLANQLNNDIYILLQYQNGISEILKYEMFFNSDDKDRINKLVSYQNNLNTNVLKEILENHSEYDKELQENLHNNHIYNKYTQSDFYKMIYFDYVESYKTKNKETYLTPKIKNSIRKRAKQLVDTMNILFKKKSNFDLINPQIYKAMSKGNFTYEDIKSNIEKLHSLLEIPDKKSKKYFDYISENVFTVVSSPNIQQIIQGQITLIESDSQIKKESTYSDLVELNNDIIEENHFTNIKQYNEKIRSININVIENSSYQNIIKKIHLYEDFLECFKNNSPSQIQQLYYIVDDSKEENQSVSLTSSELESVENVSKEFQKFYDWVKNPKTNHNIKENSNKKQSNEQKNNIIVATDSNALAQFKSQCDNNKFFEQHFESVIFNYNQVKEIISNLQMSKNQNDKSNKNIVTYICSSGIVTLFQNDNCYDCNVKYTDEEGTETQKTIDEILDIRDTVLLSKGKKSESQMNLSNTSINKNEYINNIEHFSNIITGLSNIQKKIINLELKGFPHTPTYKYQFKDNRLKKEYNNECSETDIESELNYLDDKLKIFTSEIVQRYLKNIMLTFVYGKHSINIYNYITSKNNSISIFSYVKYLSFGKGKDIPSIQIKKENSILDNVGDFITKIHTELNINNFDEFFKIKSDIKTKGNIYTLEIPENNFEQEIIECYINLTDTLPSLQVVLQCSPSTTQEEITAFYYRCVLCKSKILFCIFRIELLNIETKQCLANLLKSYNDLYSQYMKSILIVFYWNKADETIIQIDKIKDNTELQYNKVIKHDDNEKKCNLYKYFPNTRCYKSDASGVGKSFMIKKEANINGMKYIYFPIGGEFNKNDIIERLLNLNIDNKNNILFHIDLTYTRHINVMKNILFDILVFGIISSNNNLFYLNNKNIHLRIEIPFCLNSYEKQFQIIKLLPFTYLSRSQINPLESDDPLSNLQIVCSYLHYLDQKIINENDIVIDSKVPQSNQKQKSILNFSSEERMELIKKYIEFKPTFYQLMAFINILGDQFSKISICPYLTVDYVKELNLPNLRETIIKNLIKLTEYFTKGAFDDLLNQQEQTENLQNDDELDEIDNLTKPAQGITFENITSGLVFINEDKGSLSIITNQNKSENIELQQLFNSDRIELFQGNEYKGNSNNLIRLVDYKSLTHNGFLEEIKKVLNLKNPITQDENKGSDLKSLEEIAGNYVFTCDNYFKMILIILRTRAKIPVIMMGETGCGKTRLIKMLSDFKQSKKQMIICNIHAGTTDKDLIEFIHKNGLVNESNNSQEEQWVFLDEINTCHSMGLIAEMMIKHTVQGVNINSNVIFIAACNPYRLIPQNIQSKNELGLIKKKQENQKNLVYSVNPLPYSLLNYVINFGGLQKQDEQNYIVSIINDSIQEKIDKEYIEELIQQTKDAIFQSHIINKESNGICATSLRDVRRFVILLDWLFNYLKTKKTIRAESARYNYRHRNSKELELVIESILISLYLCYIIRLPIKETREKLEEQIDTIFKSGLKMKDIIKREQYEILDNINLPKGIAKNNALLENVFSLFVCVNCKLPLFICGKPGCSKSYALRLLCNSMKGKYSSNQFFKLYPRIIEHSYQGSRTSTSEGVLKLFEKARQALADPSLKNDNEEIISLIVFDEMGLAEISPHNPLKVIHAELEYDEQKEENKVAFVGISNWKLDASKMNRGIFLSIPEPDETDLIDTAITIANTYNNLGQANSELFTGLAKTYYEYKKKLTQTNKELEDYHGARDFYHLIKETAKKLLKNPARGDLKKIASNVENTLERNFGGLPDSVLTIKEICHRKLPDLGLKASSEYKVLDCLEDSLLDNDSRYSLIISRSALSPIIITDILKRLKREYVFISGSRFEGDQLSEEYSLNVLNQITSYMNEPKVLILQNMESLYPSLYDLFNQNFIEMDNRKYARISLGFKNNLLCQVHKQFKCIVLVDQNELFQQEAPFLNRFEKQIISLENIIDIKDESVKQIPSKINNYMEKLFKFMPHFKKDIDISKNKINCNFDNIQELMYIALQKKIPLDKIESYIIDSITPSLTQDVLGCLSRTLLSLQNPGIAKTIENSYLNNHKYNNIEDYIQHKQKNRLVIFNFNSIVEPIEVFNKDQISEILILSCDNEKQFVKEFTEFVEDKKKNLLFIRFRPCDCKHLNHIRYITEKPEYNLKKNKLNKTIVFLIHMSRFFPNYKKTKEEIIRDSLDIQNLISLLASDYEQVTIDDLYDVNQKNIISLTKCSNVELFKLINFPQFIKKQIPTCFSYIDYDILNKPKEFYDDKVISSTIQNPFFLNAFHNIITNKYIPSCTISWNSFLNQLSIYITPNSTSFYGVFENYLKSQLNFALLKVIYASERDQVISPLLFGLQTPIANTIVQEYYNDLNLDLEYVQLQQSIRANKLQYIVDLSIPSVTKIIREITSEIKLIKEQYLDLDSKLRLGENDKLTQGTIININEILKAKKLHIDNMYMFLCNLKAMSILNNDSFFLRNENYDIAKSDYAKIFLTSNGFVQQDITKIEEFMNLFFLLVETNIEGENLYKYLYVILNCEAYNEHIKHLCEVFKEYIPFIKDLCLKIQNKIKTNSVVLEDNHKNKINKPFILIIETFLQIVKEVYDSNNSISEDNSGLFMKALKITQQVFNNINLALKLNSKELYFFNSFMECVSLLNLVRKGDIAHLKKMQALSSEERKLLIEKKEELLTKNLSEQLTYLKTECSNLTPDFSKYMIEILVSKYNQFSGRKYHEAIFNYVFSINELIIQCQPLLVQFIDPSPVLRISSKQTASQAINNFISFAKENTAHIGLVKFNETKNEIAIDVLLFFFEVAIYKTIYPYHKELNNYKDAYLGLALNYFDISINNIETYNTSPSNLKNYQLKQIAFIYSIAYVKVYLHFLAEAVIKTKQTKIDLTNFNKIMQDNKGKVSETIKIYFMKCLRAYFSSLKMFAHAPWQTYKLEWIENYSSKINFPHVFNTALITINDVDLYYKMENALKKVLFQNNLDTKEVKTLLSSKSLSFLTFFDVTTNKLLSFLQSTETLNSTDYNNLSSFCDILFPKLVSEKVISSNTKTLLDLYYKKETFSEIIYPIIKNLTINEYEIFIYLYKLTLLVSISSKENYYSELLFTSIKKTIDNNYNPGVDPMINAKITGYYFVKSMFDSPNFKRPENFSPGVYRCDCGYVYQLVDCGFPWDIYKCSNCRQDIGGHHHNLVCRPGHVRIIINKEEETFLKTKTYVWIKEKRYLFWKDYKAEMEKIIDKEPKGVPQVEFDIFSTDDKIVRSLDTISYRLLNLVFYSCVYFSHLMKFLSKEDLKNYTCNNHTCLEMLKVSFNNLENALYQSSITQTIMFLNVVIPTLHSHIRDAKMFNTKKERDNFEVKVAKDIKKEIKLFETNSLVKYRNENNKLLGTEKESIEGIINEIHLPKKNDNNNKYPLLHFFVKSSYPDSDILSEKLMQIDNKNALYPVLSAYVSLEGIDASKLNSFLEMNPFVNEMISRYSFKISREEARKKTIKSELDKIGGVEIMKKYNSFIEHYNKLLRECNKYKCKTLEYPGQIKSDSQFAYVLNDDGDNIFGMHIASIYQHFIEWQNNFINYVLNYLTQDNPLYYLKNTLEQKMLLFNSTKSNIIDTTLKGNQLLSSINDLIWCYSSRNCYSLSKNQIIYDKYKNYSIDYKAIDIALGKCLLTNKRKFEDTQTFVIYKYEAYRSSGSSIIIDYLNKYEQRQLNETERLDLEAFKKKERDVQDIMFSLQQLIGFISKQNFKPSISISDAIKRKPEYLNIKNYICSFFEEHPSLKLNTLIEIYEQFELICVDEILLNVDTVATIEYSEKEKEKIINEIRNYSNEKISLVVIEHAVRKYITRMLGGTRTDSDLGEEGKVISQLARPELWPKNIRDKMENYENDIFTLDTLFELKVKNIVHFYRLLKEHRIHSNY